MYMEKENLYTIAANFTSGLSFLDRSRCMGCFGENQIVCNFCPQFPQFKEKRKKIIKTKQMSAIWKRKRRKKAKDNYITQEQEAVCKIW